MDRATQTYVTLSKAHKNKAGHIQTTKPLQTHGLPIQTQRRAPPSEAFPVPLPPAPASWQWS